MPVALCARLMIVVGGFYLSIATAFAAEDVKPRLRRPVAMALSADESRLFVANRDAGTVSIIDAAEGKVIREEKLGEQLSDIERLGDAVILATDPTAH